MTKKPILITIEEDVVEQIDAVVPKGERSAWIETLCQAALAGGAPLATAPSPTDDDAQVWRAVAEALYKLWTATQPGKAHDITPVDDYVDLNTYMAQHNGGGRSHA